MANLYVLEFQILGLPKMTNPSGAKSTHWRVKHAEAQNWKSWVFQTVGNRRPLVPLARAKLTLTRCSLVRPDNDGLTSGFKHVIDGLVYAKILENDRFKNIGMPDYRWEHAPPGKGFIKVRVEELEVSQQ